PGEVTPDLDVTTTPDNSSGNGSENTSGPRAVECRISLSAECIDCDFNVSCQYGTKQRASCMPKPSVNCS
ncbi:unnamed protein product, partial [Candidula unifasciata]